MVFTFWISTVGFLPDNRGEFRNNKMEEFLGKKNLAMNLDKSNFMVIGNIKERNS